jgi:hypothetical protein
MFKLFRVSFLQELSHRLEGYRCDAIGNITIEANLAATEMVVGSSPEKSINEDPDLVVVEVMLVLVMVLLLFVMLILSAVFRVIVVDSGLRMVLTDRGTCPEIIVGRLISKNQKLLEMLKALDFVCVEQLLEFFLLLLHLQLLKLLSDFSLLLFLGQVLEARVVGVLMHQRVELVNLMLNLIDSLVGLVDRFNDQ